MLATAVEQSRARYGHESLSQDKVLAGKDHPLQNSAFLGAKTHHNFVGPSYSLYISSARPN